ncbi:hypothetical protein TKK_0012609 [Trichogramma kaykai]
MCDILPDSVHSILNDIETGASIPFLLIILFYTLYYAFHHIRNIMCVVKDILRKRACKRRKCPKKPRCPNIIDKIKDAVVGFFTTSVQSLLEKEGSLCCKPKKKRRCRKDDDDLWDDDAQLTDIY